MPQGRRLDFINEHGVDAFLLLSHVAIAVVVTLSVEAVHSLHPGFRFGIATVYLAAACVIWWMLRKRQASVEKGRFDEEIAKMNERIAQKDKEIAGRDDKIKQWARYERLRGQMLDITTEFLKQRCRTYYSLSDKIRSAAANGRIDVETVCNALTSADGERREHIEVALRHLSTSLVEDSFLVPSNPDEAIKDIFKVSVYVVEHDEQQGKDRLLPKWRFYPNEGEPRTRGFNLAEGASGTAWQTKRIVVCENRGAEEIFKDMWDGGGQKPHYASMICVPVLEQKRPDRPSEVYGVVTVDSPVRRGYFAKSLEQFWADLVDPVCRILIYCRSAEVLMKEIKEAMRCQVDCACTTKRGGVHDGGQGHSP